MSLSPCSLALTNLAGAQKGTSSGQRTALQTAYNNNITVIVSAGNDNADACGYTPSSSPHVVAVGSVDSTDKKALSSNWGPCVALSAPGVRITSSSNLGDGLYASKSGTSMSAPHVAGIVAAFLATPQGRLVSNPRQIAGALLASATADAVVGNTPTTPNLMAYSRVNAGAASVANLTTCRIVQNCTRYTGSVSYSVLPMSRCRGVECCDGSTDLRVRRSGRVAATRCRRAAASR